MQAALKGMRPDDWSIIFSLVLFYLSPNKYKYKFFLINTKHTRYVRGVLYVKLKTNNLGVAQRGTNHNMHVHVAHAYEDFL